MTVDARTLNDGQRDEPAIGGGSRSETTHDRVDGDRHPASVGPTETRDRLPPGTAESLRRYKPSTASPRRTVRGYAVDPGWRQTAGGSRQDASPAASRPIAARRQTQRRSPAGSTRQTTAPARPWPARTVRRKHAQRLPSSRGAAALHRGSSRARPGGASVPWAGSKPPSGVVGTTRVQIVASWSTVSTRAGSPRNPLRSPAPVVPSRVCAPSRRRGRASDSRTTVAGRPECDGTTCSTRSRFGRDQSLREIPAAGGEPIVALDEQLVAAVAVEVGTLRSSRASPPVRDRALVPLTVEDDDPPSSEPTSRQTSRRPFPSKSARCGGPILPGTEHRRPRRARPSVRHRRDHRARRSRRQPAYLAGGWSQTTTSARPSPSRSPTVNALGVPVSVPDPVSPERLAVAEREGLSAARRWSARAWCASVVGPQDDIEVPAVAIEVAELARRSPMSRIPTDAPPRAGAYPRRPGHRAPRAAPMLGSVDTVEARTIVGLPTQGVSCSTSRSARPWPSHARTSITRT